MKSIMPSKFFGDLLYPLNKKYLSKPFEELDLGVDYKLSICLLDLTNKCKTNCDHCGGNYSSKGDIHLNLDDFEKFLRENSNFIKLNNIFNFSNADSFEFNFNNQNVLDVVNMLNDFDSGIKRYYICTSGWSEENLHHNELFEKVLSYNKSIINNGKIYFVLRILARNPIQLVRAG